MKTFEDYKTMISVMAGDENQKRYSVEMVKTGLLLALKDYDRFLPKKIEQIVPIIPISRFQFFVPWMIEPEQIIFSVRTDKPASSSKRHFGSADSFRWQRTNSGCLFTILNPAFNVAGDKQVLLEISEAHTIAKLGSASSTSVPDGHMEILCRGGSGYTMQMRAASITEVVGRQAEDHETLIRQSAALIQRFLQDLESMTISLSGNSNALPTAGFSD